MIGTLARKCKLLRLPQLFAVAAIAALMGGLFAASSPARAALGDVSANVGYCVQSNAGQDGVVRGTTVAGGTAVTVDNGSSQVEVTCGAGLAGLPVSVTPNGTARPTVTLIRPTLTISVDGHPDGVIMSGNRNLTVRLKYNNLVRFTHTDDAGLVESEVVGGDATYQFPDAPDDQVDENHAIRVDYILASSGLASPDLNNYVGTGNTWVDGEVAYGNWFIAPGTPPGEYVLSAGVSYDRYRVRSEEGVTALTGQLKITVVDSVASNLDSATLSLGNTMEDNPLTSRDETVAGTGTAAADGGSIWLKLESKNALGAPSIGSRLTSVSAFGLGGTFAFYSATAAGHLGDALTTNPVPASLTLNAAANVVVGPTIYLQVTKSDGKAGTVDVNALVVGPDGAAETETLTLTFTGSPARLTLGDDVNIGRPAAGGDSLTEISLSAVDSQGNAVEPGSVTYMVTDADGNAVSSAAISVDTSTAGASTPSTGSDDSNAPAALVTVSDAAEPGNYTITASLLGVDGSADSAMVTVTGPAASVQLATDKASGSEIGEVITVTASVADADGNPVADGMDVTFTSSGTSLVAIGTDANATLGGRQSKTVGGDAAAKFTVIGSGVSVISAAIAGQNAVVVLTSTAGMAPAETPVEEEERGPRLSDLSRRTGLASYQGPDTTASELMSLLAGRASALWLSSGRSWVLYATVNGALVPGAANFAVTSGDVLYISR